MRRNNILWTQDNVAAPPKGIISTTTAGTVNTVTYNFSAISPAVALTAGLPASVTLNCPSGVSGSDANHYLYIANNGTPETVLITGGTCTGSGSGTLTFTPTYIHTSGLWMLISARGGIQEALNASTAPAVVVSPGAVALNGLVTVPAFDEVQLRRTSSFLVLLPNSVIAIALRRIS